MKIYRRLFYIGCILFYMTVFVFPVATIITLIATPILSLCIYKGYFKFIGIGRISNTILYILCLLAFVCFAIFFQHGKYTVHFASIFFDGRINSHNEYFAGSEEQGGDDESVYTFMPAHVEDKTAIKISSIFFYLLSAMSFLATYILLGLSQKCLVKHNISSDADK